MYSVCRRSRFPAVSRPKGFPLVFRSQGRASMKARYFNWRTPTSKRPAGSNTARISADLREIAHGLAHYALVEPEMSVKRSKTRGMEIAPAACGRNSHENGNGPRY